mgnify:CR=1 FL=1
MNLLRTLISTVVIACLALAASVSVNASAQPSAEPSPERQRSLVRVVRQDCGSCHGMRLTGGLGPPLTREAMAEKPVDSMAATIFHGRPGTPMPAWRSLLSEADAMWIAQRLMQGFPEEAQRQGN